MTKPLVDPGTLVERRNLVGSPYGFSGARIRDLTSAEYTLVAIAADKSGSVAGFAAEIERCIAAVVSSCRQSPRAENLLLRVCTFDQQLEEVHGFLPLAVCSARDYRGTITDGGSTALFDAAHNAIAAVDAYGRELVAQGFTVNAIVFVVTDGADNASQSTCKSVGDALAAARKGALESLNAVLVGVGLGDGEVATALSAMQKDAGFTQFVALAQADARTLAGLAAFVSRSIAVQSRALGSGTAGRTVGF